MIARRRLQEVDNLQGVIDAVKGELPPINIKAPLARIVEEEFSNSGTIVEGTVVSDEPKRSKSHVSHHISAKEFSPLKRKHT
jgi:hypothetical protein